MSKSRKDLVGFGRPRERERELASICWLASFSVFGEGESAWFVYLFIQNDFCIGMTRPRHTLFKPILFKKIRFEFIKKIQHRNGNESHGSRQAVDRNAVASFSIDERSCVCSSAALMDMKRTSGVELNSFLRNRHQGIS